ncbi:hypothetical protein QEG98_04945 [Myxococcus sp. MxC21-1]|nr:hypothetical protein [Myxococcus sp. MxC21-1]WNZ63137.1 hypothetical protein QEG98_04945 [Myxococcus sp. MxC21-1]
MTGGARGRQRTVAGRRAVAVGPERAGGVAGGTGRGQSGGGGTLDPEDPALREALARGIPLFIGYEATDGSGTPEGTERGVRRVTLRATTTPNQNPVVSDVLWDGAPLTGPLPVSREVTFTPVLAEGSVEIEETDEGPRPEQVFFSWFATGDGEVKEFRSQEPVEGRPGDPTSAYDTPATPQRVTFWVVARDGRGGVGWLSRTVDVGP